jgi:hypothetical protein
MKKSFKTILLYTPLIIALGFMIETVVYWEDSVLRYLSIMAALGWLFHFDSECALRKAEAEIDELLGENNVQG